MTKGVGLLFTTVPGWAILTVAAVLSGAGVYFANRITRSEV
jgi:Flp pilus assembly protein TadB